MDTNLNTASEIAKHERLIKVLEMINQCDRYIATKENQLAAAKGSTQWLFTNTSEIQAELRWKQSVRNRLSSYYAKQVFALASNAYNTVTEQRKPNSHQLSNT